MRTISSLCGFFCSDVYDQAPVIAELWSPAHDYQRIHIGQEPVEPAYVSLQLYAHRCEDARRLMARLAEAVPAGCALNVTHVAVCHPDWLVATEAKAVCPHAAAFASLI